MAKSKIPENHGIPWVPGLFSKNRQVFKAYFLSNFSHKTSWIFIFFFCFFVLFCCFSAVEQSLLITDDAHRKAMVPAGLAESDHLDFLE